MGALMSLVYLASRCKASDYYRTHDVVLSSGDYAQPYVVHYYEGYCTYIVICYEIDSLVS